MFWRYFCVNFFDTTKNIETNLIETQFWLRNFVLKVSEWSEIEAIYVYNGPQNAVQQESSWRIYKVWFQMVSRVCPQQCFSITFPSEVQATNLLDHQRPTYIHTLSKVRNYVFRFFRKYTNNSRSTSCPFKVFQRLLE